MRVPAPQLRAWRPALSGVAEVLHARFTDHAYPMHAHSSWTLLIVDDGAVRYDLDRHERGAYGDVVTLLPPHVPHNGCPTSSRGFRKRVLYLDTDLLPGNLVGASVDTSAIPDPGLRRAVSALHRDLLLPGEDLAAEARLADIAERLRARLGHPSVPSRPDSLAAYRLRDLLEDRVVAGLSLAEAAALLHFHPAHLVRAFGRQFGMSPHQYLISRRVDLARTLILQGRPLWSVAAGSGFYDQPHLLRHFKRILGVSPGVFARTGTRAA